LYQSYQHKQVTPNNKPASRATYAMRDVTLSSLDYTDFTTVQVSTRTDTDLYLIPKRYAEQLWQTQEIARRIIYSVTMSQQILVRGRKRFIIRTAVPNECMYSTVHRGLCAHVYVC
jgi:hypothetical protein